MDVLTQYRQLARKHKAVALRDGSLSDGLYRLGIAMQQLGASDDAVSTLRESAAVVAETSTRQSLAYVLDTHVAHHVPQRRCHSLASSTGTPVLSVQWPAHNGRVGSTTKHIAT